MIIYRLMTFIVCIYLAITPVVVYASAAENLIFKRVENFVKTSTGIVADYVFKSSASANDPNYSAANDDYYKRGHAVSNNDLGKVWRNRWAGLSNGIGGGLAATAAIAGLLAAADWILDPANNTIQKRTEGTEVQYQYTMTTPITPADGNRVCTSTSISAVSSCFISKMQAFYTNDTRFVITTVQPFSPLIPLPDLAINQTTRSLDYVITEVKNRNGGSLVVDYETDLYIKNTGQIVENVRDITEQELADVVAQADAATLKDLATSPNYVAENHQPTAAAAAGAEPKTPPCPAGSVRDPLKGTCIGADNQTKPNPTTGGTDLPEFCAYAQTLCDWLNWTKKPADFEDPTLVDIAEPDDSISPDDYQKQYFIFSHACPPSHSIPISLMGASQTIELTYEPVCTMADKMRPVIIMVAWIVAARIVTGTTKGDA